MSSLDLTLAAPSRTVRGESLFSVLRRALRLRRDERRLVHALAGKSPRLLADMGFEPAAVYDAASSWDVLGRGR